MKKIALITGIDGQDGSYLSELLLDKGYEVHGLVRRTASYPSSLRNIDSIKDKLILHFGDLENEHHLCSVVHKVQPNEIYHLAAQSDVRISFDIPEYTAEVTGIGVLKVLEAIKNFSPNSKLYYAASSEMFGSAIPPQNEQTLMIPNSPYGAAKLFGFNLCNIYRKSYNMFICSGILFNHESERRGENFVTRKITKAVANIKAGKQDILYLGNIDAKRDWGYSPDYVRAMWMMLQQEKPDDYVIGTGETHSVKDFVKEAFSLVGLDWEKYVKTDSTLYRPVEVSYLLADPTKARVLLKWVPEVSFKQLVKIMVYSDMSSI